MREKRRIQWQIGYGIQEILKFITACAKTMTNEAENVYRTKLRAFRYIFIPEGGIALEIILEADYKYVDFPHRSSFSCSDERINEIWKVSEETFRLSSGIFFIDGIKRDRWIWSGDAYQSYFINQYLFFDEEICKRTILALRGNDPIPQHLNTILDYSLYWIISLENYYTMSGDLPFLKMIYPKMESMMRYCMNQLDENGFIYGRKGDWVFVDWADIDKEGTNSAVQMLLARSYEAMVAVRKLLNMDTSEFEERFNTLKENIWKYFWEEFKPNEPEEKQYGMYGDKYGKSLCHACGASPIYLIECELPLNNGTIRLAYHNGTLKVYTDKTGGILKLREKKISLEKDKELVLQL